MRIKAIRYIFFKGDKISLYCWIIDKRRPKITIKIIFSEKDIYFVFYFSKKKPREITKISLIKKIKSKIFFKKKIAVIYV